MLSAPLKDPFRVLVDTALRRKPAHHLIRLRLLDGSGQAARSLDCGHPACLFETAFPDAIESLFRGLTAKASC